jgi:hypothetical protein
MVNNSLSNSLEALGNVPFNDLTPEQLDSVPTSPVGKLVAEAGPLHEEGTQFNLSEDPCAYRVTVHMDDVDPTFYSRSSGNTTEVVRQLRFSASASELDS